MENFEDEIMVSQPENLKKSLFPHQLAAIYKLEQREENQEIKYNEHTIIDTKISIILILQAMVKHLL